MTGSRITKKLPPKPSKKTRGAVSTTKRKPVAGEPGRVRRWLVNTAKWLVLPCACIWLVAQVDWLALRAEVQGVANKPLANISIKGEFEFLAKERIQSIVSESLNGNFVDLNLVEIKQKVEADPWVYDVRLQRVWPDGLVITVIEQKPIARWGNSGFINQYGALIHVDSNESLENLPLLFGDEHLSNEIAKTYLEMARLLASRGLNLKGVQVDSKRSWELVLDNSMLLVLGQDEVTVKLQNFLLVYEKHLAGVKHKIKRVDLRYESGLAVEWYEDTESTKIVSATH
ncbi:cell division protein FtsQ/DivIB [Saccharophagus degradans]|uniref:Cell division protein FtsQ n=1 Tax=Saccharophagus degradans TaxID=86304 RepID=A0AAW7X9K7_9GAMM|nr:cell division protein FtsQ/DivIB [Saccharophagus degradans]MDO6423208.1 cell division protein FtsQ/DivIB [Saccharophagus degradans]MDO6607268.1 cell division protein FtsQ/DivIB [Saccharophagus degradans]